ncbi:MAG: phage holin family protein [Patescibacteria group bacterium]
MYLLARWLVSALALMATAYVIPGITVDSLYAALIVALVVGLLNAIVRPILIVLTLPITILTFGLFVFVINGAMLIIASSFLQGFHVDSWFTAIIGAVVLSVMSWIGNQFLHTSRHE